MLIFRSKMKLNNTILNYEYDLNKQYYRKQKMSSSNSLVSLLTLMLILGLTRPNRQLILSICFTVLFIIIGIEWIKKHQMMLKRCIMVIEECIMNILSKMKDIVNVIVMRINKMEEEFLKLSNISATINQIVFFSICEKVMIPEQSVTALYTLMFYNVITYCISYIKQLIEKNDWSLYINVATHSNIKHLAMSATKIVLEVTKAITFVITIVFMIFILCLEQRMHNYKPTKFFTIVTSCYYLATEKMFVDFFPVLLSVFQIRHLENLESLWAPILLRIVSQTLSSSVAIVMLVRGIYLPAFVAMYVNVYLSYKWLNSGPWKVLNEESAVVSQFRYASKQELDEFEDVCAVCLNDMNLARITPCHHIFHTDCLRKCLLGCNICPVCKREFKFD